MIETRRFRLVALEARPLDVPLREPFVIATGMMLATRAALVEAIIEDERGARATGYGEAAALPPVTWEDQPQLLQILAGCSSSIVSEPRAWIDWEPWLDAALGQSMVARAAVETALLDALARLEGVSMAALLAGTPGAMGMVRMKTDVTLSIGEPEQMARSACAWRAKGFDTFKVKVGRSKERDREALRAVHRALPDARFRIDANEGFTARDALTLLEGALADGLTIECFEQPCRRDDLEGMHQVTLHSPVPIVADESLRSEADLDVILSARAASAINLKLVKLGGPIRARAIGLRAAAEGLELMVGAMVETRLGLTAMAHVAHSLGTPAWIDLDTALLLDGDPFEGGMRIDGDQIEFDATLPGLSVSPRRDAS